MSRVGADTTLLRATVTSGVVDVAGSVVVGVGALIAMALVDGWLLLVTVVAVGLGLAVVSTVVRRIRELSRRAQDEVGAMTAAVERALSAVRTIRASGATDREVDVVGGSATRAYAAGVQVARVEAIVSPASSIAVQGAFLAVLGLGGYRVATGSIDVADLVAFILYLFLLVMPLGQAISAWTQLQTGLGALARIQEVLGLEPEDDHRPERGGATALPRLPAAGDPTPLLELDDVRFAYPDGTEVLRGVSLTVPAGSRVALVGPSGAGKSTILALVEGFYPLTGGAIRWAGTDVRELPRAALRARLGYVEQEAPVLAGTVRDNLLLAAARRHRPRPLGGARRRRPHRRRPALRPRARRAGRGRRRAALRRGAPAAGDRALAARPAGAAAPRRADREPRRPQRELLRDTLAAAAADRALLVVAHRLSTVRDSDQIVVLDAGESWRRGTHDELVEDSPLYRELATAQLLV